MQCLSTSGGYKKTISFSHFLKSYYSLYWTAHLPSGDAFHSRTRTFWKAGNTGLQLPLSFALQCWMQILKGFIRYDCLLDKCVFNASKDFQPGLWSRGVGVGRIFNLRSRSRRKS